MIIMTSLLLLATLVIGVTFTATATATTPSAFAAKKGYSGKDQKQDPVIN